MKLIDEWVTLLRTPGNTRVGTIALLVAWALAAIWGWFFVEPMVLRHNQLARDLVEFGILAFPWLKGIRELGVHAEKGLFLHSVFHVVSAPAAMASVVLYVKRSVGSLRPLKVEKMWQQVLVVVGLGMTLTVLVIGIYDWLLQLDPAGALHRTGHSIAVSGFLVPILAPLISYGLWSWVFILIFSIAQIFRRYSGEE